MIIAVILGACNLIKHQKILGQLVVTVPSACTGETFQIQTRKQYHRISFLEKKG